MTRKLLLADDSVTIQRVVELTFSGENIEVTTVGDGEAAIARLSAEPPDIVLADIAMPKKNGYEVAAFVKEHPTLSHVPVLLLAGAFEPVDEERAKRVKCDGVLVKPFETHEVIARVRELIEAERPGDVPAPKVAEAPPRPRAQVVEMPQPPQAARTDQSLDEYFDRLDVAFATRAQNPPRPFPHLSVPETEAALPEPAPYTPSAGTTAAGAGTTVADLFKQFFEVEQGARDAESIRVPDEIERIKRRSAHE
jgi:CheY-like chemotaxis protein